MIMQKQNIRLPNQIRRLGRKWHIVLPVLFIIVVMSVYGYSMARNSPTTIKAETKGFREDISSKTNKQIPQPQSDKTKTDQRVSKSTTVTKSTQDNGTHHERVANKLKQRVNQDLQNGKITNEQAEQIYQKIDDLTSIESALKSQSASERRTTKLRIRNETLQWASQYRISSQYFKGMI